jgi:pimeloyl-ACP methyl ester carboxylesterase
MVRFARSSGVLRGVLLAALCAVAVAAPAPADPDAPGPAGVTEWTTTPAGRLKAQVFVSPEAGDHPILIVVLHGDAPFSKPSYQYAFARRAARAGDVVAAAILRPGYSDPSGDASSGERGLTTGDNYTRDRIDMIAGAIGELQRRRHARAVVLAGHSGGAAISADLLAVHPELARAALLVSCPCDVATWRAHMKSVQKVAIWDRPVSSLSPQDLASEVPKDDHVRMMVGAADAVAPPGLTRAYAAALSGRGVDVAVVELPGKEHEIFLEPAVQDELRVLVAVVAAASSASAAH